MKTIEVNAGGDWPAVHTKHQYERLNSSYGGIFYKWSSGKLTRVAFSKTKRWATAEFNGNGTVRPVENHCDYSAVRVVISDGHTHIDQATHIKSEQTYLRLLMNGTLCFREMCRSVQTITQPCKR
jgi:hypothetical protein